MPWSEREGPPGRPRRARRRRSGAVPHLGRGPGRLRMRQEAAQLLVAQLAQRQLGALGAERGVARHALLPVGPGAPAEHETELVLGILGDPAAHRDFPRLAVHLDDASGHYGSLLTSSHRSQEPDSYSATARIRASSRRSSSAGGASDRWLSASRLSLHSRKSSGRPARRNSQRRLPRASCSAASSPTAARYSASDPSRTLTRETVSVRGTSDRAFRELLQRPLHV